MKAKLDILISKTQCVRLIRAGGLMLVTALTILSQWTTTGKTNGATKPTPASPSRSLGSILNPDGTLNPASAQGNFEVSGYSMEYTATGAPRFVPLDCGPSSAKWDTQFSTSNGLNSYYGYVLALAVSGTEIYVGGFFTGIGSLSVNSIAKYNTATNTWSALGSGGGNGVGGKSGFSGTVTTLLVQGNEIYAGGYFQSANYGGTTEISINNLAKFNTATNTWSQLGTGGSNGVNGSVYEIVTIGTDLFVGGDFRQVNVGGGNEIPANNIARFNTLTNTWSALGSGTGNGVQNDRDYDTRHGVVGGYVLALSALGNDLYVGGFFNKANFGGGATELVVGHIARFNVATNAWGQVGTGTNAGIVTDTQRFYSVYELAASGTTLYVGGEFKQVTNGGAALPFIANSIARFDTLTNNWTPLGSSTSNGVRGLVRTITLIGTDLYAGGQLAAANTGGAGPEVPADNLARFNTATNTWVAVTGVGRDGTRDGYSVGEILGSIALNGELYLGGGFERVNVGGAPKVIANNLAKFNPASNIWSALSSGNGKGTNGVIHALLIAGDEMYVGGSFTQVGNVSANRVAKFNLTTKTWSALGSGTGNGVGAPTAYGSYYTFVSALVLKGNDLYVGGSFLTANVGGGASQIAANSVARVNLTTGVWSALAQGSGNGVRVSDAVNALAVIGNTLYVGGQLYEANAGGGASTLAVNSLAKFDTVTNTWGIVGSSGGNGVEVGGVVSALLPIGTDLYVGGAFSHVNAGGGAAQVPANSVAKLNTLTQTWSALGSGTGNGVEGWVKALALIGSDLYVGGSIYRANFGGGAGEFLTTNLARFNLTTNQWSRVGNAGVGKFDSQAIVSALAANGNDLYVGGRFSQVNLEAAAPLQANSVARFNTASNTWHALQTSSGNGVADLRISEAGIKALAVKNNDLYVGGVFDVVNDGVGSIPASNLAKWTGANVTTTTLAASPTNTSLGQPVTFTATVTSPVGTVLDGCVTFRDGNTVLAANVPVSAAQSFSNAIGGNAKGRTALAATGQASFTTSALSSGTHTITATYSGAADYESSQGQLNLMVEWPDTVLAVNLGEPQSCLTPGMVANASVTLTNPLAVPSGSSSFQVYLPTQMRAIAGSCQVSKDNCIINPSSAPAVSWLGTLAAGESVTLRFQVRLTDSVSNGTALCMNVNSFFSSLSGSQPTKQVCMTINCPPVGPGALADNTQSSDQTPGSVLIYNYYTSDATAANRQNTRFNLTNVHPTRAAYMHLFFVDGASCSVADSYICLTPNQTASALLSDLDPGTSGYIVAVATEAQNGCPIEFNYLIGDAYVKTATGHQANLLAEAFTALPGGLPACNPTTSETELRFDGISYSPMPRVLALDNFASPADGNNTILILNRIGGNLATGAAGIGALFGLLYDDAEKPLSFSLNGGSCQLRVPVTGNGIRTTPRLETVVGAGRNGWLKLWNSADAGMLGAAINSTPNALANSGAFNQGHNLHHLRYTTAARLTIPVFRPSC